MTKHVSNIGIPFELVLTRKDFRRMMRDLRGCVSFDIETNGLYPWAADAVITQIGFGTRKNNWIIPFPHHPDCPWTWEQIEDMIEEITEIIDDLLLVMQNGKFDLLWMRRFFGVKWPIFFDTMIAHYLIDENLQHGLKFLAKYYYGAKDWDISLKEKKGAASLEKLGGYHAGDLHYTRKLRFTLQEELDEDPQIKRVFDKILMPCVRLFAEVEYNGVCVDISKFDEAEEYLRGVYDEALENLAQWEPDHYWTKGTKKSPPRRVDIDPNSTTKKVPKRFNWGSTDQLAWLLFDHLDMGVIEYTKTGNPSCSESVIKRLDHPCADDLLKFRGAKQQLSFFIDGWKPHLHERPDGFYLHPSFKLHGTVTGRLSCENPNLQQVPRDRRIRSLITAPDGWEFMECDLSQVELRVAAELAGEENMINAFNSGIDVHWLTAVQEIARGGALPDLVKETASTYKQKYLKKNSPVDNYSDAIDLLLEMGHETAIEIDYRWKEFRKKAKAVNFGYLYGMWWKRFKEYARDNYGVIMTDEDSAESRVAFFDNYPDLPDWHDRQKKFANKHGYVRTLSGRKRRLPAARWSGRDPKKQAAERQAINSPVQGFANEINLMAAIQLRQEYDERVVKICGTVHDSVLLRVRKSHVKEVYYRLLEIMRRPNLMDDFGITLSVPIEADGEIGPWGQGVAIDKWEAAN